MDVGYYVSNIIEEMKALLIAIFVIAGLSASGQTVGYLSFSPEDRGVGLRWDVDNGYIAMSHGNYYLPYGGYIYDHTRVGIGFIHKWFTLGVVYHTFGEVYESLPLNKASLQPISVEVGARVFVTGRFTAALRYDVMRCEGTVDFGINFNNVK